MKLTNTLRDAYIASALSDVPSVNHDEEIRKLVVADFVDRLPPKVRKVWEDSSTRHYIKTDYGSWGGVSVTVPHPETISYNRCPSLSPETKARVDALKAERDACSKVRSELTQKLKSAAYGCTTRKQLAELLPEFEKYLPADEAKAIRQNLPAVANLVADFAKAGWPKSKSAAA